MFGQGSFQVTNNFPPTPAPGPPFVATSADNGLSVDPVTGRIVIGQAVGAVADPAQLLSNREIPLKGFSFTLGEAGAIHLSIDPATMVYSIGDVSTTNNGTGIVIDDNFINMRFNNAAETMLFLAKQVYSMGNVTDTLLGSKISIDDLNESLVFRSLARGRMMDLAGFNKLYRIGDIDATNNKLVFSINDNANTTGIESNGNPFLFIDAANRYFALGDDNGAFNGTELSINDNTGRIVLYGPINAGAAKPMIDLDGVGNLYTIGDSAGVPGFNGLHFTLNDATGNVIIKNTANTSFITMNGVIGFTGTVTPVTTITVNGGIVTNVA